MMIPELLLVILLIVGLMGVYGDSVLQCTNRTIEVKDGDTVILPCSREDKMDISYEEVIWKFKDPTTGEDKTVHTYFQGEDYPQIQSDDFKDRTSLFKKELSSGNCSLSLLVTTSHSGRYHSCVGGRLYCTVTLKVLPKAMNTSQMHQDDPESPDNPNSGGGVVAGAVIGGVVVAALIILALYFSQKRLKQLCSQRNYNNPPINLELPLQAQQPPQNQEKKPLDQNPNEDQRRSCSWQLKQEHPSFC